MPRVTYLSSMSCLYLYICSLGLLAWFMHMTNVYFPILLLAHRSLSLQLANFSHSRAVFYRLYFHIFKCLPPSIDTKEQITKLRSNCHMRQYQWDNSQDFVDALLALLLWPCSTNFKSVCFFLLHWLLCFVRLSFQWSEVKYPMRCSLSGIMQWTGWLLDSNWMLSVHKNLI